MPSWLFLIMLGLSIPGNLALNALWVWVATRVLRTPHHGYLRSLVVVFGMGAPIMLIGMTCWLWGLSSGLCAFAMVASGIVLGLWLCRKLFGSSLGRSAAVLAIAFALCMITNSLLAVAIKLTIMEAFHLGGTAMEPTMAEGSRFAIDKTATVHRWNVVVYRVLDHPENTRAARIVGTPGERIEIVDGEVLVNGVVTKKPAATANIQYVGNRPAGRMNTGGTGKPITLGPNEYFVLGDNAMGSLDSRYWDIPYPGHQLGALPREQIVGVVRLVYWPPKQWRLFGD